MEDFNKSSNKSIKKKASKTTLMVSVGASHYLIERPSGFVPHVPKSPCHQIP